jgi:hypothetical protein
MLSIREEQMLAFSIEAKKQFEKEIVQHISEFAPKQYEILGESTIGRIVRLGIERAENYGFTDRGPARFYVEMMFMFGSDFDTDPQYPWAAEILFAESEDQIIRADRLHAEAMKYIEMVGGPDLEYEKEALNRILALSQRGSTPSEIGAEAVPDYLRMIYPQKCEYMGDEAIDALVQLGTVSSGNYSASSKDVVVFVGLMFIFGHGCLSDPQYPWIANTLERSAPGDMPSKIGHLRAKTRIYLETALNALEGRKNASGWTQ